MRNTFSTSQPFECFPSKLDFKQISRGFVRFDEKDWLVKNLPRSQSLSFLNLSFSAITNQIQANQCATRMKNSINMVRITALYCEYLSIFWSNRASLSNLVNFTKWILPCPDSWREEKRNINCYYVLKLRSRLFIVDGNKPWFVSVSK